TSVKRAESEGAAIAWKEIYMSFWTRMEGFMDEAAVDERRYRKKKNFIGKIQMVTEEEVEVYMIIFWTLERLLTLSLGPSFLRRFSLVMCSSSPNLLTRKTQEALADNNWIQDISGGLTAVDVHLQTGVPDVHIWKHLVLTRCYAVGEFQFL
ncbi:hypothetical protein ACJX0J_031056, partial [Zea mays]